MFDECDTLIVSAAMAVSGYPKAIAAWQRMLDDIIKYRSISLKMHEVFIRILKIKMPEHWKNEGAEDPNTIARINAILSCDEIYKLCGLLPSRVDCTIENGIYLVFKLDSKNLILEAYNTNEIGVIITEGRKILFNEDIMNFNFSNCINKFVNMRKSL